MHLGIYSLFPDREVNLLLVGTRCLLFFMHDRSFLLQTWASFTPYTASLSGRQRTFWYKASPGLRATYCCIASSTQLPLGGGAARHRSVQSNVVYTLPAAA